MIDRDHTLNVTRQAALLGISRGSVYYLPRPVSEADLALMRRIDELHLEHPLAQGCKLSMDGRGAWRDNVSSSAWAQREVRAGLSEGVRQRERSACRHCRYIHGYNTGRPHSSLEDVTPETAYLNGLPKLAEAA